MRPQSLEVPYRYQVVDDGLLLSKKWTDFFRVVYEELTGKHYAATSEYFAISTSGYATGEWAGLVGNSVLLPPGTWDLDGAVIADWTGSAPAWTALYGLWSLTAGANTATTPTFVETKAGHPLLSLDITANVHQHRPMPVARIAISEETRIYLNAGVSFSSANTGRLQTVIYAKRVTQSVRES